MAKNTDPKPCLSILRDGDLDLREQLKENGIICGNCGQRQNPEQDEEMLWPVRGPDWQYGIYDDKLLGV